MVYKPASLTIACAISWKRENSILTLQPQNLIQGIKITASHMYFLSKILSTAIAFSFFPKISNGEKNRSGNRRRESSTIHFNYHRHKGKWEEGKLAYIFPSWFSKKERLIISWFVKYQM